MSIFPFEKNRYFPRKRMRSADFTRELEYIDRKFQFLSRFALGSGVALGLQVQRLDSASVLVSPGMGVDPLGRWVVLEEPQVCALSSLPGFDSLSGETGLLQISYQEEEREPVTVAGEQGEREEFTVRRERWAFSIAPWDPESGDALAQPFFSRQLVCQGGGIRVWQVLPRMLSCSRMVKVMLVLENQNLEPMDVFLRYRPTLPGFQRPEGAGLGTEEKLHLPGGITRWEQVLTPDTQARSALFNLKRADISLEVEGEIWSGEEDFQLELPISGDPIPPLEQKLQCYSLDEFWQEGQESIPLAGIKLIRCGEQVFLDDVLPLPFPSQAHLPAFGPLIQQAGTFFPAEVHVPSPEEMLAPSPVTATGVITLSPWEGEREDGGWVVLSPETAHGLGPGPVEMEGAWERLYPLPGGQGAGRELLTGDTSLFAPEAVSLGIRVLAHKGTFQMAVRVPREWGRQPVRLRWFARRGRENGEQNPEIRKEGKLLGLEPGVVYAQPGETVSFAPVFRGPSAPCRFFLPEGQGGLLTGEGVYTAPQREGLYQVCAHIQGKAETRVEAFVIVRKPEGKGDPHDNARI